MSLFGQTIMGYLGFWVIRNDVRLLNKKVEAINIVIPLTARKEACKFIGLTNYHRNMCARNSHIL